MLLTALEDARLRCHLRDVASGEHQFAELIEALSGAPCKALPKQQGLATLLFPAMVEQDAPLGNRVDLSVVLDGNRCQVEIDLDSGRTPKKPAIQIWLPAKHTSPRPRYQTGRTCVSWSSR